MGHSGGLVAKMKAEESFRASLSAAIKSAKADGLTPSDILDYLQLSIKGIAMAEKEEPASHAS